jgi:hypothetical protein
MEFNMKRNLKVWAGLGVAVLAGHAQGMPMTPAFQTTPERLITVSGEAGETAAVAHADDTQGEYIAALGLVDSYVQLARQLPKSNALAEAKEKAVDLKSTLKKHKAKLDLNRFQVSIKAARGSGEDVSAHNMVVAVLALVKSADSEFAEGDQKGKINALSGRQKAWGLLQAAKNIMADITQQERDEHTGPLAEIDAALAATDPVWPDLKRDQPPKADPALLVAAAAKIEFALAAIK